MAEMTNGPQNATGPEGRSDSPAELEAVDPEIEHLEQLANDDRLNVRSSFPLPDPPKPTYERPDAPKTTVTGIGGARISRAVNSVPGLAGESVEAARKTAIASTIGVSFVTAIIGGAAIGWVLDKYVFHNTQTPWGLVIGVLLGTVAGFMNVTKILAQMRGDGS